MFASRMMTMVLCLSVMISNSVSLRYYRYGGGQRGPRHSPNARLTKYCSIFAYEKIDEGYGRCNWKVLDEVYDVDKKLYYDGYMLELYRMARNGRLCYADGPRVATVRGPCDALELACLRQAPKVIDECSRVMAATRPPMPPASARPYPPATPPGHWF